MFKEFEEAKLLPGPYEFVELVEGYDYYFAFDSWEIGKAIIKPEYPHAPPSKEIYVVRLYAKPGYKEYAPYYWDLAPARLVWELVRILPNMDYVNFGLKIWRVGSGPAAHFGVQIVPLAEIPKPIRHMSKSGTI